MSMDTFTRPAKSTLWYSAEASARLPLKTPWPSGFRLCARLQDLVPAIFVWSELVLAHSRFPRCRGCIAVQLLLCTQIPIRISLARPESLIPRLYLSWKCLGRTFFETITCPKLGAVVCSVLRKACPSVRGVRETIAHGQVEYRKAVNLFPPHAAGD